MNRKFGLTAPLRRGSRDFEAASGVGLLVAKTKQVLLTEPGELPWRTSFGAGLGRLRHQNNDAVLRELARVAVRDAMARWMREVRLLRLETKSVDGALAVEVTVDETDTESTNVEAIL